MPLADVLSALREIILEDCALVPELEKDRFRSFSKKFPKLSAPELEDLVAISPQQFSIYTSTIFAGEASILLRHLPVSLGVISNSWQGSKYSAVELLKRVHKSSPWGSAKVEDLVTSLKIYLKQDGRILGECPFLWDLIEFERLSLLTRRSRDDEFSSKPYYDIFELNKLRLDSLLEKDFFKPQNVQTLQVSWDVVEYTRSFYRKNHFPLEVPSKRKSFNVISRNAENKVCSVEVPEYLQNFYSGIESAKAVEIRKLAELVHEESQVSEEDSLRIFVSIFSSLIDVGAIKVFTSGKVNG